MYNFRRKISLNLFMLGLNIICKISAGVFVTFAETSKIG